MVGYSIILKSQVMSPSPTISVLIPAYNAEKTIRRAMASVLRQTLQPFEILIVDDGSTDNTESVVKEICGDLDPDFIKYVKLDSNYGVYYARNVGWNMARGEFLALLDADDSWHPQKLEIQAGYMAKHDEITLTAHKCICLSGNNCESIVPDQWKTSAISAWQLMLSYQFWTPSVMLRTNIPFRFDPQKRFSGDRVMWIELAFKDYKITRLDLSLGYIHKAPFGEGGLSSRLWETEKSELGNLTQVRKMGFINRGQEIVLKSWSLMKYVRRLIISWRRQSVS